MVASSFDIGLVILFLESTLGQDKCIHLEKKLGTMTSGNGRDLLGGVIGFFVIFWLNKASLSNGVY